MIKKADQSGAKDVREFVSNKELIFLIPILGSALAIMYDVGFFSGIDKNFFTLFSLNEHIGFALEVFPDAFFMAALFSIVIIWDQENSIDGRIKAIEPTGVTPTTKWISKVPLFTPLVAILGVALWATGYVDWLLLLGIFVGIALAALTPWIIQARPIFRYIFGAVLVATLAILYGFISAYSNLHTETTSTTIERKTDGAVQAKIIQANIIRSGDRGVLFYDPQKKQVALLRWDEIREIRKAR